MENKNKFKIGDKVRVKEGYECNSCRNKILTIINIDYNKVYPISTIDGLGQTEPFYDTALELFSLEESIKSLDKGYWDILDECSEIAKQRETKYGDIVSNFEGIQTCYKEITGKDIELIEIINIMIATKLNRRRTSPDHEDNDLDLINYIAIGTQLKRNKK